VSGFDIGKLLRRNVDRLGLAQAVRLVEMKVRVAGIARRKGGQGSALGEVGGNLPLSEEPVRLVASDRMTLVSNEIAGVFERKGGGLTVTTNVAGLAGATPALPAFYSEVQLQRRRLRDRSLADFLNIFDHRALSFFYRTFRKYNRLVSFEREPETGTDPASRVLLALGGFATPAGSDRLSFADIGLAGMAGQIGNMRRTASGLEAILRHITGMDLNIVQATPVWMPLPDEEQTRLGKPGTAQFAQLGGTDAATGLGVADAAVLGAAVLDIQHHYTIEIGPVRHAELLTFCLPDGPAAKIAEVCLLMTGVSYRPALRLLIDADEIPPLRLGAPHAPAILGRATWLSGEGPTLRSDCVIQIEPGLASMTEAVPHAS
jgi:type VI secretion system protein ImpH